MAGTESMETISRISELQPMSQETISILDRAGSKGNSTISRPVDVRPPKKRQSRYQGDRDARTKKKENGKLFLGLKCLFRFQMLCHLCYPWPPGSRAGTWSSTCCLLGGGSIKWN